MGCAKFWAIFPQNLKVVEPIQWSRCKAKVMRKIRQHPKDLVTND
jgi:hypothetical protein